MEKVYMKSELVQMIEDMKTEERIDCDVFCDRNMGAANDARRHDSLMILNALNAVLYGLDALN